MYVGMLESSIDVSERVRCRRLALVRHVHTIPWSSFTHATCARARTPKPSIITVIVTNG